MPAPRVNPYRVKLLRSYTASELAACCGVHKNTVRHWRRAGLDAIDGNRPVLFLGAAVREFLTKRRTARKCPCPPGTIFCFRCRQPRAPAMGMVEYVSMTAASGNLRAICEFCEAWMHRRVRLADIGKVMPGLAVPITEGQPSLIERTHPSLNCDSGTGG